MLFFVAGNERPWTLHFGLPVLGSCYWITGRVRLARFVAKSLRKLPSNFCLATRALGVFGSQVVPGGSKEIGMGLTCKLYRVTSLSIKYTMTLRLICAARPETYLRKRDCHILKFKIKLLRFCLCTLYCVTMYDDDVRGNFCLSSVFTPTQVMTCSGIGLCVTIHSRAH